MPTARELLEQADALMRRNRALGRADGEPRKANDPLTLGASGSAPPLVSPRTIALEPIAPGIARTLLPIDPIESPSPDPRAGADDDDDNVPVLTEAVVDASPASEVAEMNDVPLLTDAVEEIEVTVVGNDNAEVIETARGEVSVWPQAPDDDRSLTGRPPGSIASETDVPEVPQSPPVGRDPLGLDQPAVGFVAPPGALPEEAIAARETDASLESPIVEAAVVATSDEASAANTGVDDVVAHDAAIDEASASAHDKATDKALVEGNVETTPPVVVRSDADEARIREIAEEIGMQVLQRIDIFTDTSLREKVGERLKPVVERVSAELVDALNQHVGELLRAYVAEAIEREIETWRKRE